MKKNRNWKTLSICHLPSYILHLFILYSITCTFSSCHTYSFTGASLSPDIKTFSVQYFPNRAPIIQPSLSQQFTEKLKEKFISQTNVDLVNNNGDLSFEGAIIDYSVQPTAILGSEQAALNRLTITVSVKFVNNKDTKQNFESSFSRFADYDSRKSLSEVESGLISDITSQLVDDIFNKAVINW